ncbi:hypothetical protein B0H16DRAFT_385053 [Mycena metata]|uniref:Uncharacterized protein n=1 Tax=Mycena metata TaxID=1033252 RepID=A0AAD7NLK2_9AGAR|nr:hypothetical protein B0H16DRAFT_385053 [Mycena metata]
MGFLPVFYHHLDPAQIPSNAEMDVLALPEATSATISRAFLCLQGLSNLVWPPAGPHADLWRRVWPWTQFFEAHHSRIPEAPTEDVVRACCFICIARLTEQRSPTTRLMLATPGVGTLAGRAWGAYYRDPNLTTELTLRNICQLLSFSWGFQAVNFQEFVDGAGGFDALAILVVRMIPYLIDGPISTDSKAMHLFHLMWFCYQSKEKAWVAAQVEHKVLPATISVLIFADRGLERSDAPVGLYPELFQLAWCIFLPLVLYGDGYLRKLEAIDAGVLPLFVSTVQKHVDWADERMRTLITTILLRATLYYPVLSAIEAVLPSLDEGISTPAFTSSLVYPEWQAFIELAVERIEIKREIDSGQHVSYRACDNLQASLTLFLSFATPVTHNMDSAERFSRSVALNVVLGASICTTVAKNASSRIGMTATEEGAKSLAHLTAGALHISTVPASAPPATELSSGQ